MIQYLSTFFYSCKSYAGRALNLLIVFFDLPAVFFYMSYYAPSILVFFAGELMTYHW
jgi:hypothetical protein